MKEMKNLTELFSKKHYWERKRDSLHNQLLWNYFSVSLLLLSSTTFLWTQLKFFPPKKTKIEWYYVVELVFYSAITIFWFWNICKDTFDCYYKLPKYRRKLDEIDHQIIEELKKLST